MKKQISQITKGPFVVFIITAFLSMDFLTGCAKMSTSQESIDTSQETSTEISISSQETQISSTDSENLSDDAVKIQEMAEIIFAAYFKGDTETLETYALNTEERFESYPNAGEETSIPEYKIKGLADVKDMNLNSTCEIWCEFKASPQDDYFQYLTITFIKMEDGWKVQSISTEM